MTQTKTLFCNGTNFGGGGKTWGMVQVADWLKVNGIGYACIDADPGNAGTSRSFSHFLQSAKDLKSGKKNVRRVNIQDEEDLYSIFSLAAEASGPVLCDLPANSSGNMETWWADVATPDVFASENLRLVTLLPVPNSPDTVQNALRCLETVGNQGTFIIALTRLNYALVPKPVEIAFSDWYSVADSLSEYDIKVIEIGHLSMHVAREFIAAGCLPSQFSGDILKTNAVKSWSEKVHKQLDAAAIL